MSDELTQTLEECIDICIRLKESSLTSRNEYKQYMGGDFLKTYTQASLKIDQKIDSIEETLVLLLNEHCSSI